MRGRPNLSKLAKIEGFFFVILKPESGVGPNSEKPATSRAGIGQDPTHPGPLSTNKFGPLSTNKYDTYYIHMCMYALSPLCI